MTADVTVVMPVRNRAALLPRALRSIAAQSLPVREVIVVDDGSSDGSGEVARRHGARVITLSTGGGSGPARNAGIHAAETEWIAFLDSDDEWLPHHVAKLASYAQGHVLVTSPARSSSGRILGNPWRRAVRLSSLELLVPGEGVCTSGTMVARHSLQQAGLFRPLPRAQDLDLWIRVLETGTGLAVPGPSVSYHEHAGQASGDRHLMRQCFEQIVTDYADRPWMTPGAVDASFSRVRWDDLRTAQRSRDVRGVAAQVRWFVQHPHAVSALRRLLLQRRAARRLIAP